MGTWEGDGRLRYAGPVRFSPSGRWVAFGDGGVVPARGGAALTPLGKVAAWEWSPSEDVLAGVSADGGLSVSGPSSAPQRLLPEGWNTWGGVGMTQTPRPLLCARVV